jgi:hypothetical protein
MAPLPTRPLGKNGPQVPRLGFGTMGLSVFYGPAKPDAERLALLDKAYELGETFWDSGMSRHLPSASHLIHVTNPYPDFSATVWRQRSPHRQMARRQPLQAQRHLPRHEILLPPRQRRARHRHDRRKRQAVLCRVSGAPRRRLHRSLLRSPSRPEHAHRRDRPGTG